MENITIQTKILRNEVRLPKYAHPTGDSGMDLFAAAYSSSKNLTIEYPEYDLGPGETVLAKIGIAVAIPVGYEIQVRPTSGNSLKTMVRVANAPGTIDANYRGELGVILTNTGDTTVKLGNFAKVAQMVVVPVLNANLELVDELPSTDRGADGYGSTGTI